MPRTLILASTRTWQSFVPSNYPWGCCRGSTLRAHRRSNLFGRKTAFTQHTSCCEYLRPANLRVLPLLPNSPKLFACDVDPVAADRLFDLVPFVSSNHTVSGVFRRARHVELAFHVCRNQLYSQRRNQRETTSTSSRAAPPRAATTAGTRSLLLPRRKYLNLTRRQGHQQ